MIARAILVSILATALLSGCASTSGIGGAALPAGFPDHSAESILGSLPTPDSLWTTFRADLAISFSTKEGSGSISARVDYADSILVRFRAPLGIEVSRALFTRDSVFIYDRIEKVLLVAPRSASSRILPAGLDASDLAPALFGFQPPEAGSWSVRADSLTYQLIGDGARRDLIIDPAMWRIVADTRRNASGTVVDLRRYSQFEWMAGVRIPRRIVTSRPAEDSRASIYVRRVNSAPSALSFDLGLPDSIRRIHIQ